jgi:hypothetical protein
LTALESCFVMGDDWILAPEGEIAPADGVGTMGGGVALFVPVPGIMTGASRLSAITFLIFSLG